MLYTSSCGPNSTNLIVSSEVAEQAATDLPERAGNSLKVMRSGSFISGERAGLNPPRALYISGRI